MDEAMMTPAQTIPRVISEHWWTRDCSDPWSEWVFVARGQVWEWAYRPGSHPRAWCMVIVIERFGDDVAVRSSKWPTDKETWMSLDELMECARPTWVPWPHPDIG